MSSVGASLPIIDIGPLVTGRGAVSAVAAEIGQACREVGFFYIVGHGVAPVLQARLESLSRQFFALDEAEKMTIRMARGGRAWRGYFPVGDELTSGRPDLKEGLYFGAELGPEDPRVQAGLPLHGANLFPEALPELRPVVLGYLDALTRLGHTLVRGLALSLGLGPTYFADRYTADPLVLFRIFHYPPAPVAESSEAPAWGVGEHTDYGLLTILKQDAVGGLQVQSRGSWIDAPPVPNSFVCNLGDMLDRMTGGRYRSTPHRVRNASGRGRLSFPFFFDPGFDARIESIPFPEEDRPPPEHAARWDGADVHAFDGTYGDYVLAKVANVFPMLRRDVL